MAQASSAITLRSKARIEALDADCAVSGLILLNGTTDYLELWADPAVGTYTALEVAALVKRTLLSAFWVGGAS